MCYKMVDKGDADIFHYHLLYGSDGADLHIGFEIIDILIMHMQDLHQVAVRIGIILAEYQTVIIQFFEVNGLFGQWMVGGTDTDRIGFKKFITFVFRGRTVCIYDTETDPSCF